MLCYILPVCCSSCWFSLLSEICLLLFCEGLFDFVQHWVFTLFLHFFIVPKCRCIHFVQLYYGCAITLEIMEQAIYVRKELDRIKFVKYGLLGSKRKVLQDFRGNLQVIQNFDSVTDIARGLLRFTFQPTSAAFSGVAFLFLVSGWLCTVSNG